MTYSLIFLTSSTINKRLIESLYPYSNNDLIKNIVFFSTQNYLGNKLSLMETKNDIIKHKVIYSNSKSHTIKYIENIKKNALVINDLNINYENKFIFDTCIRNKVNTGFLIWDYTANRKKDIQEKIFLGIKYPLQTIKYLLKSKKINLINFTPKVMFCAGSYSYNKYSKLRGKSNIIKAYHPDYSKYIKSKNPVDTIINKPYAVLIGDVWPELHPDQISNNVFPKNKIFDYDYEIKMLTFLKNLKKVTNLEIIISKHPRGNYSPIIDKECKFYKNKKTADLVNGSSLVIITSSNAINFALLNSKPIIFYKYEGFSYNHKRQILSSAKFFDKNVFNISNEIFTKKRYDMEKKINHLKYSEYIDKYIIEYDLILKNNDNIYNFYEQYFLQNK